MYVNAMAKYKGHLHLMHSAGACWAEKCSACSVSAHVILMGWFTPWAIPSVVLFSLANYVVVLHKVMTSPPHNVLGWRPGAITTKLWLFLKFNSMKWSCLHTARVTLPIFKAFKMREHLLALQFVLPSAAVQVRSWVRLQFLWLFVEQGWKMSFFFWIFYPSTAVVVCSWLCWFA